MEIVSDFRQDDRHPDKPSGAYEWWYFDAVDRDSGYKIVVIFYEGNPFSSRYIRRLKKNGRSEASSPERFPAVSISVYRDTETVYYSFTEFDKEDCHFGEQGAKVRVGEHTLRSVKEDGRLTYHLNLKEQLPSGDALVGNLSFSSPVRFKNLFDGEQEQGDEKRGHSWNLVQPCAHVEGRIKLFARGEDVRAVDFEGEGYHDHNTGMEPMRNEFEEWYWGRFHFDDATFVYYSMKMRDEEENKHRAWLISNDNSRIIQRFEDVLLEDRTFTIFGLKVARKITVSNKDAHITIQQSKKLDNGPFYQRYNSDAFLTVTDANVMQASEGITEYIRPDRIYNRLFWPLIHMRMRYEHKAPHWVQQSKTLYRWTW